MTVGEYPNECCNASENLVRIDAVGGDSYCEVCKVCERRHFTLILEPGDYSVEGSKAN
jgi:hypothetical protein